MISLEQVKLLESKVTRTIEYVKKVTDENSKLKEKLDSYQKRIDDLEVLVQRFKEDQSRIEDGILSALDRLNQFEDALESKLSVGTILSPESKISHESKLSPESKPAGKAVHAAKKKAEPIVEPESSPPNDENGPAASGAELDIF